MRVRSGVWRHAMCMALAMCAGPCWSATHTVLIEGMQFKPQTLTVKRGDEVVWLNKDFMPHTATATRVFDSGNIPAGGSGRVVPTRRGRFPYACALHPSMKAVLIVE